MKSKQLLKRTTIWHSKILGSTLYLISCLTTFYLQSFDIFDKPYCEYYFIMIAFMVLIKVLSFKCMAFFLVLNENKIRLVIITLVSLHMSYCLWQFSNFYLKKINDDSITLCDEFYSFLAYSSRNASCKLISIYRFLCYCQLSYRVYHEPTLKVIHRSSACTARIFQVYHG